MECRRESVQSSTVVPRGSIPGRAGRCSDRYLLEKLGFFYSPPPTEALRGSLFLVPGAARACSAALATRQPAPAPPGAPGIGGWSMPRIHVRGGSALCSCASWLCTQRAASSNRIFARALPGFPVSTEHLPRPEVVTLGLYGNPRRRPPTLHRELIAEPRSIAMRLCGRTRQAWRG